MNKKPDKQAVVTSIGMLLWIFLVNIVAPLVTTAPPWPMFMVTIFFFTLGGDTKQIKSIFLSGIFGIASTFVIYQLLMFLTPIIGGTIALTILLFLILALIIVGGNWFPVIFNNITFAFLTICTIDMSIINERSMEWMLMFVVGGVIILAGALLIAKGVDMFFANKRETVQEA